MGDWKIEKHMLKIENMSAANPKFGDKRFRLIGLNAVFPVKNRLADII
jgi:hypothetical protein